MKCTFVTRRPKMFLLLFQCVISTSIQLNKETIDDVFNKSLPIFVEIWDPWCQHCKHFKPSWEALSNDPELSDKVIFADVNCVSQKSIAKQFPGSGTPRFFWVDSRTKSKRQYVGPNIDLLMRDFILKQLHPTIYQIDQNSIPNLSTYASVQPIFFFNISKVDDTSIHLCEELVSEHSNLDVNFTVYYDDTIHHPTVTWIARDGVTNSFNLEWNYENLHNFIMIHSLHFLTLYTQLVNYYIDVFNLTTFVFLFPTNNENHIKLINSAKAVESFGLTTRTDCQRYNYICRYTSRWPKNNGNIILINKNMKKFWTYDKEIEPKQVFQWAKAVLDGEIKAKGPYNMIPRQLWDFLYEIRGVGGFRYYILLVPIGMSSLIVLMFLFSLLSQIKFKRRNHNHIE